MVSPDQAQRSRPEPSLHSAYGRRRTLDEALQALQQGRDVIIEGEIGMGRNRTRLAIAGLAQAHAMPVTSLRAAAADAPADVNAAVVTGDAADFGADQLTALAKSRADGARLLISRTPSAPFSAAESDLDFLLRQPLRITLGPLSAAETELLFDEMVASEAIPVAPARIERDFVRLEGGGFPALTEMLMLDLAEHLSSTSRITPLSRRAVAAASEVIGALTPQLRRLALDLSHLNGVSMDRLHGPFDGVELSMLIESNVIRESHGRLLMTPPMQGALRMLDADGSLSEASREVILDIATSISIGTDCTCTELSAAAAAISADQQLREQLSAELQTVVQCTELWVQRRRGSSDHAALLARRLMRLIPPGSASADLIRLAAQHPHDDFAAYARLVQESDQRLGVESWQWLLCLQLPLADSADGALELLRCVRDAFDADARPRVEALLLAVEAGAALGRNEHDRALELAAAARATGEPSAVLRGITVANAVHAMRLDGPALLDGAEDLVRVIGRIREGRGIETDLELESAIDALLYLAASFGAIGAPAPAAVSQLVESMLEGALAFHLDSAIARLSLARAALWVNEGRHDQARACVRFLGRLRSSAVAAWALARFGDGPAPRHRTDHVLGSSFIGYAVEAMEAFNESRLSNASTFESVRDSLNCTSAAGRLIDMFVSTSVGEAAPDPSAYAQWNPLPGSIPDAMLAYCQGVHDADAEALARAATIFERFGAHYSAFLAVQEGLRHTEAGTGRARALRSKRRSISSQIRATSASNEELTPRELQVAGLAGAGLSNQRIAEELFLSVRTVESHLYRAMRKLAVSREDLAQAISR